MVDRIRRLGETPDIDEAIRLAVEPPPEDVGCLVFVEEALRDLWNLGRNLVLAWSKTEGGIAVLVVPHYAIALPREADGALAASIDLLLAGPKRRDVEDMGELARDLGGYDLAAIPLPVGTPIDPERVDELIGRFGITYVGDRAVALFDIVGFSLLSPLEQVAQLNSLSYSINSAHSKMLSKQIDVSFARSTTGDGFYVWNRDRSIQANVNLYHFMHLVLANNAIARRKSRGTAIPALRTAFHIGGHYEYYQAEGLAPTIYSFIVGDVTIELARLIEQAVPGQIVMGDFQVPMPDAQTHQTIRVDPRTFIERTQKTLSSLEGLVLSGEPVDAIRCYLTGRKGPDGTYANTKYTIVDKHGLRRHAYNAKINIYRKNADPIYLGVQNRDLRMQPAATMESLAS